MEERNVPLYNQQTKAIKITKWKVRPNLSISIGHLLLLYDFVDAKIAQNRKLKSTTAGIIRKIVAQEGEIINKGQILLEIEPCLHPTIMNDMCAECGADLRKDDIIGSASVPMVHSIPDLKVSEELALKIGKADNERLLNDRKLVLLVDLDQTLIHTTNDNIPSNIKDIYHFQLHGHTSQWYHTRLRPGTHQFLQSIHKYFELHICTFGARNYAHTIAMFLDTDQKIFSNRILSRDECFDPTSKKANLKALFPCGDNMVCIIDDREDVWSHASNLIHVKAYHFFQHTGDINAPPGLDKHEEDDKTGVDLSHLIKTGKNVDSTEKIKAKSIKDENNVDEKQQNVEQQKDENKELEKVEKVIEKVETKSAEDITKNGNEICEIEKTNGTNLENGDSLETKTTLEIKNDENDVDNKNVEKDGKDVENVEDSKVDTNEPNPKPKKLDDENMIEIEDPDDYLIYLEDILKKIYHNFYEAYDKMEAGSVPDLKKVIPEVRSRVLRDCKLVFSGLVPTRTKLEHSKAYQVARSLGAVVTQDLETDTTHLVAVRPGTVKVNAGKKRKNFKIVTPDWLWCCAERWEHVDERIFPLEKKGSKNRHPPPHCSSPQHLEYPQHNSPAIRKRTPSGKFMDTINPLMSFSSDDIANMDKEVEASLSNESDTSDQGEDDFDPDSLGNWDDPTSPEIVEIDDATSSTSENSISGDYPKGFKRKMLVDAIDENDDPDNSSDEESPSVKFRRGEHLDNDIIDMDADDNQDSDGSVEPPDEVDDGEWNMMGAALEREFLANN